MNIGIIIQARMGSTRLPGKILKQFYGNKTLLETILENLHNIKQAKIIVATSENTNDDALEKFLKEKNEIVYRGSEKDVLERLAQEGQLMGYRYDGFWQCMDTKREKDRLEALWASGNAPWKTWD